jgi:tRNA-dihydrouridine synthase A
MMDYTNRHFRAMIRLISSRTVLYTEMVAVDELLNARQSDIHQYFDQSAIIPEGPSVLQLGGNDATQLYEAARIYHKRSEAGKIHYTALNLNCGCPSPSVSGKKCFGAALMKDPSQVAKLVRAMHHGVDGELPVSIKCRIGLHNDNETPFSRLTYDKQSGDQEYSKLHKFIETIAADGLVTEFIIHARIAVLGGSFSAADNRMIPPLKYEYVHRLTRDFPELKFVLNGGIQSLARAQEEMELCNSLAGVMVGRAMVADPWSFAMTDELLYGDIDSQRKLCANRRELLQAYGHHVDYEESQDPAAIRRQLVAPCAHLFAGEANSKQFRKELDEIAGRPERLEREAKARVWSNSNSGGTQSILASAFATSSKQSVGWDVLQALDDARPSWDANEPPLSKLILDAAQRNFGDELLNLDRNESYARKLCGKAVDGRRVNSISSSGSIDEVVSGGVIDGWFANGLD